MQNQRELMCQALDEWFIENGEKHLGVPVTHDTALDYEQVVASSRGGKGWNVHVEGAVGDVPFKSSFFMEQLSGDRFKVSLEKLARMDDVQLKKIAEQSARAVDATADVADGEKTLQMTKAYHVTTGDQSFILTGLMEFGNKLIKWYDAKSGTVLDELVANLRAPPDGDVLSSLTGMGSHLISNSAIAEAYPNFCEVELLVLRGYTQRPSDIDRDLGWDDTPPLPRHSDGASEAATRDRYEKQNNSWMWDEISPATNKLFRNGSLYGAVCAALRDQGPQGPKGAWSEKIVKKWIKWICTLAACTATDKPSRTALWRGLGGGGLPGDVVDMHATLKEGDLLAWPAPSSASFNYETSREYVFGTAVNSTGSPSQEKPGTIMFNIKSALGLPLQAISQYPTEEELLLSPLTVFTVRGVARDAANRFGKGLSVEMACQGPMGGAASECAWLRSFYDRVRADAKRGSAVIGQRVQSLHLEPKPFDGNDSLVATIKTQLESQRSKTSDLRSQLEDEMRELRKESAGNAKWKRMYELEKAGRDELGAKLAEEARGAAAARLQADQALREANARLQAAKAEVEKLRADVKSERLQASAQLDEARRKLDVEKTCLSGREAELTAKLSAMESENAKHARDARTQQEEAQLWKKRHDEAIHQAAESARGLEAKLSDKLAAVSSELRELKLDFAEVRSQKEQLTTEATRWQTQAEAREAETERTRERMAADREKQREELAAQLGKAAALERELEASRAQTNLDASEAARARQDREREQHAAAELKRKLDDAKRNHASETEALADRLKDEESQRRRTTQELARAKEAASSARNDAQDYRRRLEACQAELQRARELGRGDASELESKLQAAKEESAAARSTLQRDLALSKTAAAQAAARANALELECDRKVRLAQEEANLTAARLQEVLNSKIRALADAQGELRREHDSRISAAAAAEADRAQAQADARKQDALLADLTQHNKTLQAAVRAAELEAADAQKSAARLAAKAQEAEAAEAHAKTALQAVAGGSKGLLEQIEDKEREVALLRSEHRAYIEKLNEQMRVLRAEVQCEQLRVEDQKDTVVKCRREIARLHDLLSLAKRETDDAKFEAGASRSPVDWAGSSMTFVGSPTHRRVLSSPLTPSPRVESSSSYAAHSLAASDIPSPGLQRLETTIRRFRMEVDSVKHSLPSSPLRPSGSSLGRAS